MSGKIFLRCDSKTLLGIVNILLKTKSTLAIQIQIQAVWGITIFFSGKIRNVDRLERIKEEQRKIEQEAQEQAKIDERKQKEQADTLKPVSTPEVILAQVNIYFSPNKLYGS